MGYNYSYAKPAASNGDWEKVIAADCPLDPYDLSPLGPDDCFKLEFSGWTHHVEFMPKEDA